MTEQTNAASSPRTLLDASDVAAELNCSKRHIFRLVARGVIPPPLRIGSLARWRRDHIEAWIQQGCENSGHLPDSKREVRRGP